MLRVSPVHSPRKRTSRWLMPRFASSFTRAAIVSGLPAIVTLKLFFFFSSRRRHTIYWRDWSSDVCSSDLDHIRHYLHLGTGNYHPSTARFYTDLSLFTANEELGEEVAMLFNTLTGLSEFKGIKQLLVAPFSMHDAFLKLIHHERDLARAGKEGRIIVKLNSLVEESLIAALYEASQAGVKIDLIVRGICCLRPGVPGVSDNIRVISIVGRFLEHSRIYFFGNAGRPKVYLGSADWMPRNLFRRVEVVFPVLDPGLLKRLTDIIIPGYLNDCVKARLLGSDGVYTRAVCPS